MEPLEDRLRKAPESQVEVPGFRQRLRRDLLDAHPGEAQPAIPYRTAAYGAAGVSLALVGLLVLFIVKPTYPLQLHFALSKGKSTLQSESHQRSALPLTAGLEGEASPVSLSQAGLWEDALQADRDLVRSWARQTYTAQPVSIEPIHEPETYTVSSFKLNNGKYVQIHTRVPQRKREQVQNVSY